MTAQSGTHSIGPENGQLTVNTYVGGMGAKMGHDLVLEATRWSGTVTVDPANPSATAIQVSIDPGSLEVLKATGGIKPLSENDKGDIAQNRDKTLKQGKFPEITFQSTDVTGAPPSLALQGNLTIAGSTQPVSLNLTVEDGPSQTTVRGSTQLQQTAFGIKPYSKLGALKVKDEVDINIEVNLPSA